MPEHDSHQRSLSILIGRLQFWLTDGELQTRPTTIQLGGGQRVTPDVFWVGPHNVRCTVNPNGDWRGAPDLVVEVVSPATEAEDRGEKYNLYQQHQVWEYWIVNPVAEFIEVYVLMNKRFFRTGLYRAGTSFSSGVLNGRTFEVNDLLGKSRSE